MTIPVNPYINPSHAKLHQKVLELHTGKAFANPNSWISKMRTKWWALSEKQRKLFGGLVNLSSLVSFFSLIFSWILFEPSKSVAIMGMATWTTYVIFLVVLEDDINNKRTCQEQTANLLGRVLKDHPNCEALVRDLNQHLNHPDILGSWWKDVDRILQSIMDEQPLPKNSHQDKLSRMLDGEQDTVVIDDIEHDTPISQRQISSLKI